MHNIGLFESRVQHVIREGIHRVSEEGMLTWLNQIKKNWDFYNGQQMQYLEPYPGEKIEEFNAKKKCPFNYTGAVVDEYIAGVYDMPVARTFKSDVNNDIMKKITDKFPFDPFFKKVQKIAEISALCGVIIRFDELSKQLFLEEIPSEYVKIYQNKKYADGVEHVIIAYPFDNEDGEGIKTRIEGWSREHVVVYETDGKNTREVYTAENELKDEQGLPFIPIVFFRPDEDIHSPYGHTNIDTIVEINHTYNSMWMDIMRTIQMQQFSLLFLKRPIDDRGEKPKPLTIAPTRMIEDGHKDADAKYITPDPKINESLEGLYRLREELLDLSKVPIEVMGAGTKRGVEAAATLRLKKMPLDRVWKKRKTAYSVPERELGRKLILMAKAVWDEGDFSDLFPQIDYSEAMQPTDPKEKMESEAFDLQLGLTNPFKMYLDRDPDIGGIDEAKKAVQNNFALTQEALGNIPSAKNLTNPKESVDDFVERIKQFKQISHAVADKL